MNYYNYFTEIEEHFVRRRGKHLLISPMDWSLIATWRDSGVPLHVALRGIDKAMDVFYAKQHRGVGKVNTLFYCHDTVMEEYARSLEARVGEETSGPAQKENAPTRESTSAEGREPTLHQVLDFVGARISEIKSLREKHFSEKNESLVETVDRILFRLEEVARDLAAKAQPDFESLERDLGILDDALVEGLRSTISPEQIQKWEGEAKKELKVYKKRLPHETYQKILQNFLRGKIHRNFEIGELSLFHL